MSRSASVLGHRSSSSTRRRKRVAQAKERSTTPASRQQDEAALGLREFDDLQVDAVRARPWRTFPRMALVAIGQWAGVTWMARR